MKENRTKDAMIALKKSYDQIPVPAILQQRVQESVKQGKWEQGDQMKKENRKKNIRIIAIRTGQTAAAALLAITVLANSGETISYAMEQLPVIGAITKVVTFRNYERNEGNAQANIAVPKVEGESAAEEINRSVEDYTNQIIAQFEADLAAQGESMHKGLYSSYQVVADNDKLFSLRIDTTEIMASGAQSVKLYHIDKAADQLLTLKDLFSQNENYVDLLSGQIKQQMEEQMQSDPSKSYFLNDGMESEFQAIDENQNFYINDAGHLVLVFDEYQVAPGYMGIVEFEMPSHVFPF